MNFADALKPLAGIRVQASDGRETGTATAATQMVGRDTDGVLASAEFSADDIAALTASGVV